jgi:multidrug efflux pump subunit AcrB
MNVSEPFIHRPVATTLLTTAIAIAGAIAFKVLPVSPLPQVDFPTISVGASLPGASAEIMASSVATPLERQFGHIAGVTEMTSASSLGATAITIQFDLSRNIDGAARDVEAAINAALQINTDRINFTTKRPPSWSKSFRRFRALAKSPSVAAHCRPYEWKSIPRNCTAWA